MYFADGWDLSEGFGGSKPPPYGGWIKKKAAITGTVAFFNIFNERWIILRIR